MKVAIELRVPKWTFASLNIGNSEKEYGFTLYLFGLTVFIGKVK